MATVLHKVTGNMLKILMFGWEFPPCNSGGLGVACQGLIKALVEQSVKITFDTCGDGGRAKDAVLFLVKTFKPSVHAVLEVECINTKPYFQSKEYMFEI